MIAFRLACSALLACLIAVCCGPFLQQPAFYPGAKSHIPPEQFTAGRIGVVNGAFSDFEEAISWRYWHAKPLTEVEQKSALSVLRPQFAAAANSDSAVDQWLAARNQVGTPLKSLPRSFQLREPWIYIDNCGDDAFLTAAKTLQDRRSKFAVDQVKLWLQAQDAVFANCAPTSEPLVGRPAEMKLPAPPEPGLPPLIAKDRDYQTAAAYFYAFKFDEARQRFAKIAADSNSPWQRLAPYLVGRCWLRQATLQNQTGALEEAQKVFIKLGSQGRSLLAFVDLRLRPEERMDELSTEVANGAGERLGQDLVDWRYLVKKGHTKSPLQGWIGRESQNDPVLKAASATKFDPQLDTALAAIPASSPKYSTALYHRMRLQLTSRRFEAVRAALDQAMAGLEKSQPNSARNLFYAERMSVATRLPEFVRYAPRLADFVQGDVEFEVAPKDHIPLFASDATTVFNAMSIPQLLDSAGVETLPKHLRRELLMPAFVRSLLFKRYPEAAQQVNAMKSAYPELSEQLSRFAAKPSDYEAAVLLLKAPGFHPNVRPASLRDEKAGILNEFRDNWWCPVPPEIRRYPEEQKGPVFVQQITPLLTGKTDAATISKLGNGGEYIASLLVQAVERGGADDATLPEALHMAVRAIRTSCEGMSKRGVGKQAFTMLHKRFPNSPWTKKTPYWY